MELNIKIKKLKPNAKIPFYANAGDAGVDLFSTDNYSLKPGERRLISTGISIAIPTGYEGHVRPRSGLALKHGISIVNTPGTIDSGYRGEIGVILINHGSEEYKVNDGDKVAQLVFNKFETANFEEVNELDQTQRGVGGFGSSGKK